MFLVSICFLLSALNSSGLCNIESIEGNYSSKCAIVKSACNDPFKRRIQCSNGENANLNIVWENHRSTLSTTFSCCNSSITLNMLNFASSNVKGKDCVFSNTIINIRDCILDNALFNNHPFALSGCTVTACNISLPSTKHMNTFSTQTSFHHRRIQSTSNCSVFISKSSFSSFTDTPAYASFGCDASIALSIDSCNFYNVTSSILFVRKQTQSSCDASFSNCDFLRSSLPHHADIDKYSQRWNSYSASNCSFSKWIPASYAHEYNESQQITSNDNILFDDCLFTGGSTYALSLKNATNITIHNCTFSQCNKGAISLDSVQKLVVDQSMFSNCSAETCGGAIIFHEASMIMNNSHTYNCSAKRNGGAIHENRGSTVSIESSVFQTCSDCATLDRYGGGALWFGDGGPHVVSDCQFQNNSTPMRGGALMFSFDSGYAGPFTCMIKFCYFENNSAGIEGHDVAILNNWTLTLNKNAFVECRTMTNKSLRMINGTIDVSGWMGFGYYGAIKVNNKEGMDHLACGFNQRKCKTISFSTTAQGSQDGSLTTISVDPSTYLETSCTIGSKNIKLTKSGSEEVTVISVVTSDSLFTITTGALTMTSFTLVHDTAITSLKTSLFFLSSSGSLHLQECIIHGNSSSSQGAPLQSSLFVLQGGSTSIESSTLAGFWFATTPAISFSNECSVNLTNSSISDISRINGNGGGIEGIVGANMVFDVEDCKLNRCGSNGGDGGGISLTLSDESSFNMIESSLDANEHTFDSCCSSEDDNCGGHGGGLHLSIAQSEANGFKLSSLTFRNCEALRGDDLFVRAFDLSVIALSERLEFSIDENSLTSLEGYESSTTNDTYSIPLILYFRVFSAPACVAGKEGHDFTVCGFSDFPCSTVEYALDLHFKTTPASISFLRSFVLNSQLILKQQAVHFSSEPAGSSIGISCNQDEVCACAIETRTKCLFAQILFSLNSSLNENRECVFHCCNESLSFSDCSFSADSVVAASLVIVSNGSLDVQNMTISVTEFGARPAFVVSGNDSSFTCKNIKLENEKTSFESAVVVLTDKSSLEISESVIKNIALVQNSAIEIEDSTSATVKNTTFHNVKKQSGSGGTISGVAGLEKTVSVENCSFENCKCQGAENANGGALSIEASKGGFFSFTESHINQCSVNNTSGFGGGLLITLGANTNADFLLKDSLFSNNEAKYGNDVYLICDDLNSAVIHTRFQLTFLNEEGEAIVELAGHDRNRFVDVNTDLLIFIFQLKSDVVHISSDNGFEMIGCGTAKYPCSSLSKGFANIDADAEHKKLIICGQSVVDSSYVVSNFSIESNAQQQDETVKSFLIFEGSENDIADGCFHNSFDLSLQFISILLDLSLLNKQGVIVSTKWGVLSFVSCSFASNCSELFSHMQLVVIKSGTLSISDMCINQLNLDKPLFEINSGCFCSMCSIEASDLAANSGVLEIINGTQEDANGASEIKMIGSSFQNVSCSKDGGAVFSCSPMSSSALLIDNSSFDICRADMSERGGMMLQCLNQDRRFEMNNSQITNCGCSVVSGKGGGVHLIVEGKLSPNFVFKSCVFNGNSAWKGRDIFVECWSISDQINEFQFQMDLRPDAYNRFDAIFGSDAAHDSPVDLIEYVTIYQHSTIVISSLPASNGVNGRQCGKATLPCETFGYGLRHLIIDYSSRLVVDTCTKIECECNISDVEIKSKIKEKANLTFEAGIAKTRGYLLSVGNNSIFNNLRFICLSVHALPYLSLFFINSGCIYFASCEVSGERGGESSWPTAFKLTSSELVIDDFKIVNLECLSLFECNDGKLSIRGVNVEETKTSKCSILLRNTICKIEKLNILNCDTHEGPFADVDCSPFNQETKESDALSFSLSSFSNISLSSCSSCMCFDSISEPIELLNCSFSEPDNCAPKLGSVATFSNCSSIIAQSCSAEGNIISYSNIKNNEDISDYCIYQWNSSMLHFRRCSATMSDTTLANSSIGGLSVSDAHIAIADSKFVENNPRLKKYPSLRRNMLCNDNGILHINSLKGGDGSQNDSSLWILNSGCILSGIPSARLSPLFVPSLFSVTSSSSANQTTLIFTGFLLLPCNLTFQLISKVGNLEMTENEEFSLDGYVSENEVHAMIDSSFLNNAGDEAEVSVRILFGSTDSPSQTEAFILKNKTDSKIDDEAKVAKGANGSTPSLTLIIIVLFAVLFLIVLIVAIAFIVRWKKQKRRTEELEVIVEDTVKKDPKVFEMVTMEMSPEEQWKRAEREAEKKNEERIQKRVYAKSLGHSESSEHLLSESGSTEYILGKDSDKIPDWALEKEEEEEIRKQTPSPSTSSTSTTDSDSTFVRSESLCPTTSSMSNLVDAMACSSPHEKLIVDLRDSLFMLLHGRNEKKEMAIGSLKEREQTASQILFWVANGALHSFDEMENPLSSLANLSPHIVLFSEHMVICIVMHSDLSSDDDSDSSSISSSTVVSSASDDDDDSLPSSAFEEEDDFKKECLRWKAPELLINKKMGATKKSVVFSIGMMAWECLTLQIPFGEYEAEVAGQKIINGEKMCLNSIHQSSLAAVATKCVASQWRDRPGLDQLKREFIQHFPPGAAILTMSDAVACAPASRCASGYETNVTLDACMGN